MTPPGSGRQRWDIRGVWALAVVTLAGACAHRATVAPLSEASRRLAGEAARIGPVTYEEEFTAARFVFHALPAQAAERGPLRRHLVNYLLGPLAKIHVDPAKRKGELSTDDDLDRTLVSFRDALDLYSPGELWQPGGAGIPPAEKNLLVHSAKLMVSLFAPRGAEVEVATALLVLATLQPENRTSSDQLAELFPWLETGAQLSLGGAGPKEVPTVTDALESAASVWPAPPVVERLGKAYLSRQDKIAALLRRPLGAPASRPAVSELLLDGDGVQTTAMSLTGLYLRAGQLARAKDALARAAGKPGDDPELRKLVERAAAPDAGVDDLVSLARRFLPKDEPFGGTSNDRIDFVAAGELLAIAAARWPEDTLVRLLASRVALATQDLYLSVRYLEETEPLLVKRGASRDERVTVAAELLDRSFAKLRHRLQDAEHLEPATREAEKLRQRFAESQRRFGGADLRTRGADIDFEMARGLLNAGQVEEAEALLVRVMAEAPARTEVALELGKLATKRGDARQAVRLLEPVLAQATDAAEEPETTIGAVENEAKLAYALGNAHEIAGQTEAARAHWRQALRSWDRLMREHLQRKNPGPAAEATMEVGRLLYLLGRPQEGVTKMFEAIAHNEARDQSYIDALSFLVQRGDVDASVDIFKMALSRPGRVVSEYVKVYASLWISDLTKRAGRGPEPSAEAFLRTLASRRVHLRPQRVSLWYEQLARFQLGQVSYEDLLPRADTPGKKAELHFYEAMRRLAEGRSNDAHALWNKVLETRMVEFLEFDMAARYLRVGAPTRAPIGATVGETI